MKYPIQLFYLAFVFLFIACGGEKSSEEAKNKAPTGSAVNIEIWETYDNMEAAGFLNEANIALSEHFYPGERKKMVEEMERQYQQHIADTLTDLITEPMDSAELKTAEDELLGSVEDTTATDTVAEQMKYNPLFYHLIMPLETDQRTGMVMMQEGAMVGYAVAEDTAKINSYLNHDVTFAVWPQDLVFCWSAKTELNEQLQKPICTLYALKRSKETDGPAMSANQIKDISIDMEDPGYLGVMFRFIGEASNKWKEVTNENTRKYIAIVIADKVYSAPIVHNKIESGGCKIGGNSTLEEAEELVELLTGNKR